MTSISSGKYRALAWFLCCTACADHAERDAAVAAGTRGRDSAPTVAKKLQPPATDVRTPTISIVESVQGRCTQGYALVDNACVHDALVAHHRRPELDVLVQGYRRGAAPPALPGRVQAAPAPSKAASTRVVSGVTVERRDESYTVSGDTTAELRASLKRAGTIASGGTRYEGFATRTIYWRFGYTRSPASCSVAPVALKLTAHVRLPHWFALSGAEPGLELRWKNYLGALQKHEDGHVAINIQQANLIHERLSALPPAPTCEGALTTANQLGNRLMQEEARLHAAYDEQTQHGQLQGAVLAR